jgi:predicted DCC family thiol-disulfide oxidoreductase YuxK
VSNESVERLFYDGSCALCHGMVRFVLARDPDGRAFRFAPLESEAFRAAVPGAARAGLPDSIVVSTADGRLLTRSSAVLHILDRLGGGWRVLAILGGIVPAGLRDAAYDLVARVRYGLFGRKDDACPVIPAALRGRFDL